MREGMTEIDARRPGRGRSPPHGAPGASCACAVGKRAVLRPPALRTLRRRAELPGVPHRGKWRQPAVAQSAGFRDQSAHEPVLVDYVFAYRGYIFRTTRASSRSASCRMNWCSPSRHARASGRIKIHAKAGVASGLIYEFGSFGHAQKGGLGYGNHFRAWPKNESASWPRCRPGAGRIPVPERRPDHAPAGGMVIRSNPRSSSGGKASSASRTPTWSPKTDWNSSALIR